MHYGGYIFLFGYYKKNDKENMFGVYDVDKGKFIKIRTIVST